MALDNCAFQTTAAAFAKSVCQCGGTSLALMRCAGHHIIQCARSASHHSRRALSSSTEGNRSHDLSLSNERDSIKWTPTTEAPTCNGAKHTCARFPSVMTNREVVIAKQSSQRASCVRVHTRTRQMQRGEEVRWRARAWSSAKRVRIGARACFGTIEWRAMNHLSCPYPERRPPTRANATRRLESIVSFLIDSLRHAGGLWLEVRYTQIQLSRA